MTRRAVSFFALFFGLAVFLAASIVVVRATAGADDAKKPAATVNMKGSQYGPREVTVHPGDTVLFNNDDSMSHTVTAADKSFDSGDIAAGSSWSHTFDKAGTYAYICTYHSWMHGTVKVVEASSSGQ